MDLPIKPAARLGTDDFENGRIPISELKDVRGLERFPCLLAPEMAACWIAVREAVKTRFDVDLVITGGGAYRTFDEQLTLFRQRYEFPAAPALAPKLYRTFEGRRFSLRQGMASAASPGTSNHGRGGAVDAAIFAGDKPAAGITSHTEMFDWLRQHADEFGLSWELQSEPWHLRVVKTVKAPASRATTPPKTVHKVLATTEEEDVMVFKTKQTGDKIFAQDASKVVRHISALEGAVAEAAEPGWAANAALLVVSDEVAAMLNAL